MATYLIKKATRDGLVDVETFTGDLNKRIVELSRNGGGLHMAEEIFSIPAPVEVEEIVIAAAPKVSTKKPARK